MPINRSGFVIELDVTGTEVLTVGVLMEAEYEVPFRLYPVYAVILVVDLTRVPEANFESSGFDSIGFTQERFRVNGRDDVSRPSTRGSVANVPTAGLFRHPIMYLLEECPLEISIAIGEKDHQYELARCAVGDVRHLLTSGFDVRVQLQRVLEELSVRFVLTPESDYVTAFTELSAR